MKAVAVFLLLLSCLAISHAGWFCRHAPWLSQPVKVDAGAGLVVATTRNNYAYMLVRHAWVRLSYIRIKCASVGLSGIWGIDTRNRVYRYICGNFRRGSGVSMKMIDTGGKNALVGISTQHQVHCLKSQHALSFNGYNSLPWYNLRVVLKSISCSTIGPCWGLTKHHGVICVKYTNPYNCYYARYKYLGGSFKQIEVSTFGYVFAVDFSHRVYKRIGITKTNPYGTRWIYVPVGNGIKHVSFDLGKLWVVTKFGAVKHCRI